MSFSPLSHSAQEKKEHIEKATMLTKNGRVRSLYERMQDYAIPGVSIAVINDYRLEWACGYGVRNRDEPELVEIETLFQACSISKAVTAIAILRLVEKDRLNLDADVNLFLKSWKVSANRSWQPKVTLRQVLSHTAGISIPWFAGYHRDQDLPTLREILDGKQPANTPEIRLTTLPGMRFRYSSGGYCILQQLLIDVMKKPFPKLMLDLVLRPLGMRHSTYAQPLPAHLSKMAAMGHRREGKAVAGGWYIYPELAAAGLWTTPLDLALFALELQCALEEISPRLLSRQLVKELLTPYSQGDDRGDMGLGVFIQGSGPGTRFGHPGDNAGFTSSWISLIQGGQGCILMTNSDNGWSLQQELLHTIAQVYAWPKLFPHKNHEDKNLEGPAASLYVGEYELQSGMLLAIKRVDNHLFLQMPDQPPLRLERQHEEIYCLTATNDTITFVKDKKGNVQSLLLQEEEVQMLAIKQKSPSSSPIDRTPLNGG